MLVIDKQVDVQEKHYIFITSYKSKQTNRVQCYNLELREKRLVRN